MDHTNMLKPGLPQRLEDLLAQRVYFTITETTLCDASPQGEALRDHLVDVLVKARQNVWMAEEVITSIYARAEGGDASAATGAACIQRLQEHNLLGAVLSSQNTPCSFDAILGSLHELRAIPSLRLGVVTTHPVERRRLESLSVNTPAVNGSAIVCYCGEDLLPVSTVPAVPEPAPVRTADWASRLTSLTCAAGRSQLHRQLCGELQRLNVPFNDNGAQLTFFCPAMMPFTHLEATVSFGETEATLQASFPIRLANTDPFRIAELLAYPSLTPLNPTVEEDQLRLTLPLSYAPADANLPLPMMGATFALALGDALSLLLPLCL